MKKILITGAGSYIGTSFETYIKNNYPDDYEITTVDMVDGTWREKDLSGFDSIFHVAGIAHADVGGVSEETKALYYKVNTELTAEVAERAKACGVPQFIYMSSAIVYGESAPIGKDKLITADTEPTPANFYGDSKLQAEKRILPMQDENFNVVVLRPPMIYGKGSRGNYPVLSKLARKLPLFPNVKNCRSMLYIENLCEFVRLMVKNSESGIFHPQNAQYSNTSSLVKMIAEVRGKKVRLIRGFGWLLKLTSHISGLVNKAFGSMSYDMSISEYREDYALVSLKESIERTESE